MYNKYKIAIISANFENYDENPCNLNQIKNYNYFDWFYFSDKFFINKEWKIIKSTDHLKINKDEIHQNNFNMMYANYYKIQSINLELFKNYDYIIWMDVSIEIININFVDDIINLISDEYDFYIFEHAFRDSIKQEFFESILMPKYKNQKICDQIINYYHQGYIDTKLYEAGFFIYKNNTNINILMNNWWEEILKYSYQVQISLSYVLWKNNIKPKIINEDVFIKGDITKKGSIWNNKLFGIINYLE